MVYSQSQISGNPVDYINVYTYKKFYCCYISKREPIVGINIGLIYVSVSPLTNINFFNF